MEKEIDKKNLDIKGDESIGTVQIADDVVAMIRIFSSYRGRRCQRHGM